MSELSTAEFDYELPSEAIAQHPIEPRDAARLLVAGPPVQHRTVADLPELLEPGDLLVINDTRVIPARLHLKKPTGGAVEVLLLEPTGKYDNHGKGSEWQALVRPGKRLPIGTSLELDGRTVMEVVGQLPDGRRVVSVLVDDLLEEAGEMPLPPYITEPLVDPERYQTVFAERPGSVAAPTAGLHLTNDVLDALDKRGIEVARVELRVGLGTFRPISAEMVADHEMHQESYRVAPEVWQRISDAKRVVAVGTTVVRTLESVAQSGELEGSTGLFISRGFQWQVVDRLLTNFHVPRSSLLVLVDAFVGSSWRRVYGEALDEGYRFLSFGDAMLLDRLSQ